MIRLALTVALAAAPAHSWYPSSCCKEHDCAPILCHEIQQVERGYEYRGMVIARYAVQVSEDELCHACIASGGMTGKSFLRCLFLAPGT